MPSRISRRFFTTFFSNLNGGIPKVNKPPISGYASNTIERTPLRARTSAVARPAGPAPIIATRFPVSMIFDISGRQPCLKASSLI